MESKSSLAREVTSFRSWLALSRSSDDGLFGLSTVPFGSSMLIAISSRLFSAAMKLHSNNETVTQQFRIYFGPAKFFQTPSLKDICAEDTVAPGAGVLLLANNVG